MSAAIPSIPLITVKVRKLDDRLWEIFRKEGPLTDEEQAYLDRIEAEYEDTITDEENYL